ncbi:putative phosphatase C1620.13-like protein [Carex littledalei]|uniref:Putative phosphatase C1620.13-like protein n=1 Tax=Carex littledalei TaxID=544730 RepID=A0A833V8K5_9POAL|nr:putative phosphatase C1620.13-like protein [Carex littledalei]
MGTAALLAVTSPPCFLSSAKSRRLISTTLLPLLPSSCLTHGKDESRITKVRSNVNSVSTETKSDNEASMTGAAYDFKGATISLTGEILSSPKKVTIVRHGLSSWNEESRVQGSSNLSVLTEKGVKQAERCRDALINMNFDVCFSSPISRAKSTAEVIWCGREKPLCYLNSLEEAHLFFLEGMKNADAKKQYPELYTTWREDPSNFHVNGIYPIRELWGTAREAWKEILLTPGESFLVVTHKSILRALICTALGLGPERFRAIDVNNGGICVFTFNKRGEAMLQALNMTAHMYSDHVYQY